MTTEQEFYESFEIEPKFNRFDVEYYDKKRPQNIYGGGTTYLDGETTNDEVKTRLVRLAKQKNNENIVITKFEPYYVYPPITPEIVLELMQIISDATLKKYPKTTGLNFDIKRDIKEQILSGCIQLQQEIQDQVKELFNGK